MRGALPILLLSILAAGCGRSTLISFNSSTGAGGAGGSGGGSGGDGAGGGPVCTTEVCDSLDNDCDGLVDEGCICVPGTVSSCYSGPPDTVGKGICKLGQQVCTEGQLGSCDGQVLPQMEQCNGLDDDCNGSTDEGCGCNPGQPVSCYDGPFGTQNVGLCKSGVQTCGPDGTLGPCVGSVLPSAEACNKLDDDCDGATDDGFGFIDCGLGACANTVFVCVDGVFTDECTPLPPSPEVCDGVDNDCNGVTDDTAAVGKPCDTGKPGPCAAGIGACVNGVALCSESVMPTPEQCNGIDDDCNGLVDDGCNPPVGCSDGTREGFTNIAQYPQIAACSGGFTLPGLLTTLQPACGRKAGNSSANPSGMGCNVADLCAEGFHVCKSPGEVATKSPTACAGVTNTPNLFFATRQSSSGCGVCATGMNLDPMVCNGCSCGGADCAQTVLTANDLFGCGTLGGQSGGCGALDRFSNDLCGALGAPWSCGNDGCDEANQVTKPSSMRGGVLCCAD